jgi:hypothetical protein
MMKKNIKVIGLCVMIGVAGVLFGGADAISKAPSCVKEGVEYGVVKGFRNNWWNYQERGMSYADGECFDAALADIEEAIKQRDKLMPKKQLVEGQACDERRARTYGMHFMDYFGHRERGVTLFSMGQIEEAGKELEYSLSCVESSKAQYYLDKVRETSLKQSQADTENPTVEITSFKERDYTNKIEVKIKGTARDDQFVKEIFINDSPITIPLAKKELAFSEKITLNLGWNKVEIGVKDLLGKTASKTLSIYVDRSGPQLSLENIRKLSTPGYIEVRGWVSDETGVKEFALNQTPVTVKRDKSTGTASFTAKVKMGGENKIIFSAKDHVGNTTEGTINLGQKPKGASLRQPVRYAALGVSDAYSPYSDIVSNPEYNLPHGMDSWLDNRVQVAENDMWWGLYDTYSEIMDEDPPSIKLKDLVSQQTVYFRQFYFEGNVSDVNPIKQLTINNIPIIKGERKNIFFNKIMKLRPGKNIITIRAMDTKGNVAEKTIRIVRVIPKVHKMENRMSISMLPFFQQQQFKQIGSVAYDNLVTSMVDQRRFSMVDRSKIDAIVREMRLSATQLTDQNATVKVGRLTAAEGIIMGVVKETPSSIEVYARLVDVETSAILLEKDAFHEDKSLTNLRFIMNGLAIKLKHGFPILEGEILSRQGNAFTINLGSNRLIKRGMRIIVFTEEEMIQPETGMVLGKQTQQLAEAKVVQVYDRMSKIELIKDKVAGQVAEKSLIITK